MDDFSENRDINFIYRKKPVSDSDGGYETPPVTLPTLPPPPPPPPAPPAIRPTMSSDIMEKLARNIALNTSYLRSLTAEADYIDDEARVSRNGRMPIEVRVTFIRVVDVDTCKQVYSAEVFIQAKWAEPRLAGKSQKDLDKMDLRKVWDPLLKVNNVVGDLDENKKWRCAIAEEAGYKYPVMFYRQRMRGKFTEPLELQNFPVDVQGLTLTVVSERGNAEVEIFEDGKEVSNVNTENFADQHEWLIYEHVESQCKSRSAAEEYRVEMQGGDGITDSAVKHPHADFVCHVARRPGYFLWNVILIIFMITALTFSAWAISPELPQFRLPVILLLLLTLVAFKMIMGKYLPAMPYVSYLDIYVLTALIFVCLQVIAVCVISVYAKDNHVHASGINRFMALGMAIALAFFNVVYLAFLFVLGFMKRQKMLDKDEEYFEKRKGMRNRQYRKIAHTKVVPEYEPVQDTKPKIVYINADRNEVKTVPKPHKHKKSKKQKPLPPPEEDRVYTVMPV